MSEKLVKLLSTFFYVGDCPVAPGSLASIVGMLIYFIFFKAIIVYILLFIIILILGFQTSGKMERIMRVEDPGCIVIDEVAGVMIAFFMLPLTLPVIFTAYFLFRAFDMFKIYPVNKFEEIGGGVGIMMDDIIAGIYTCIIMHVAVRLAGII